VRQPTPASNQYPSQVNFVAIVTPLKLLLDGVLAWCLALFSLVLAKSN